MSIFHSDKCIKVISEFALAAIVLQDSQMACDGLVITERLSAHINDGFFKNLLATLEDPTKITDFH